ncbi:ABC transporter permease [Rarobacter incanus]|uniref:ABC-2 type transport system permease protein n=1 Tax=Rarobacter incanus TaxID=153494 RepID=A0A542SLV9_9MICO|nr:ABC transporter permease [Rarobacter incanus]TQK75611.1 ABC-2 type transport system permease protein [Rarobacter incanus]
MTNLAPQPLSDIQATRLVAAREIRAQLRSKAFIIGTAVMLVLVIAGVVAGSVLAGKTSDPIKVGVVAATQGVTTGNPLLNPVVFSDEGSARTAILAGDVKAAILPATSTGSDPLGYYVLGDDATPEDVVSALSVQPRVELLSPPHYNEGLRYLVAFGFGLIFMIAALTFGSMIAQNTVVEKQTRTVELLISAISARSLLAGKILGNTVLALGQTTLIVGTAALGLAVTGQGEILRLVTLPMAWFIVFFIAGFVQLAALYAGAASLVSRIEDTGSVLSPVMWLAMIPYFVVVFFLGNPTVLTVASYVPFAAPVAMPVQLFTGQATWWQALISLAIVSVAAWATMLVAAKVYRSTVLSVGARVKLRTALRGAAE